MFAVAPEPPRLTLPKYLLLALLLLLLADLGHSFTQYYYTPLDGDVCDNVVPNSLFKPVLANPLGLKALTQDSLYANPNKFFSHYAQYHYFRHVPQWLQRFVDPVESVFLASALVKLGTHIMLLWGLAFLSTGRWWSSRTLVSAAIMAPLFQAYGYRSYMGVIDPAVTYVFFYALPLSWCIGLFIPVANYLWKEQPISGWTTLLVGLPLGLVSALSGPLNPAVTILGSGVVGLLLISRGLDDLVQPRIPLGARLARVYQLHRSLVLYLSVPVFCAAYSLYLGSYNSLSASSQIELTTSYGKLLVGLGDLLTAKLGWPILLVFGLLNCYLLRRFVGSATNRQVAQALGWIGLFAALYLVLLPFGGYRAYRSYLIRYDTLLPVTLMVVAFVGGSTVRLLTSLPTRYRRWYVALPVVVGLIFTLADEPNFAANACQLEALEKIRSADRGAVAVAADCKVFSWSTSQDPTAFRLNAELMVILGITDTTRLYFNAAPEAE